MCSTILSLALAKEKEEFKADDSNASKHLRPKMIGHNKKLSDLLNNTGGAPVKHLYPFTIFIRYLREDLSELIGEDLHLF